MGTGTVKYCGITGAMVIRSKSITAVIARMRTVCAVIPWEEKRKFFYKGIYSNDQLNA